MSTSLVRDIRGTVAAFLARCHVPYEVVPFDDDLYKECMDEGIRRRYLMEGSPSVRTYLREGVAYASTTCRHLPHHPTHIWTALYFACILFVDDSMTRFPMEIANIYRFNDRFVRGQAHDNGVLEAFTDLLHQVPDLFQPTASNLIVTSTLDFVTAHLLEHEIKDMQISGAAQQFATFQRMMSACSVAFMLITFPREIPVKDYIQALPEMMVFFHNTNDILSFYKEELAGETTNQISILAARNKVSKLETLTALAETTAEAFDKAVEILNGSPDACDAFKKYATGLVRFHTSTERYRLTDLELQLYEQSTDTS